MGFGNLVRFGAINLALVGKEQQVVMGVGDEHVFHKIFFFRLVCRYASAAAVLRLVLGNGQAFDITEVSHTDDHVFFLYKVGNIDIAVVIVRNFGTTRFVEFFFDFRHFFRYNIHYP